MTRGCCTGYRPDAPTTYRPDARTTRMLRLHVRPQPSTLAICGTLKGTRHSRPRERGTSGACRESMTERCGGGAGRYPYLPLDGRSTVLSLPKGRRVALLRQCSIPHDQRSQRRCRNRHPPARAWTDSPRFPPPPKILSSNFNHLYDFGKILL